MKKVTIVMFTLLSCFMLNACAPDVGSDAWCKQMKAKDAGDWTANEAADFTKHCVFK